MFYELVLQLIIIHIKQLRSRIILTNKSVKNMTLDTILNNVLNHRVAGMNIISNSNKKIYC